MPEDFQDKKKNTNVALKLHELGPRLKLKLIKIEEGVCRGNVVFHSYVKKSKKEIKEQMDGIKRKRDLKNERKRIQDENVQRKLNEKEAKEQVKEEKKKARFAAADGGEAKDSDEEIQIVPQKK